MHAKIRSLKKEDEKQLENIYIDDGLSDRLKIDLILADPNCISLVIEKSGEIIGFGALIISLSPIKGFVGKLEDIIVKKSFRGKSYGEILVEGLLEIAKERGLVNIALTSNPKKVVARNLYLKKGFTLLKTGVFLLNLK